MKTQHPQSISIRDTFKIANEGKRDYSCVMISAPNNLKNDIAEWSKKNIPEEDLYIPENDNKYGREKDTHTTLKYGLLTNDDKEVKEFLSKYSDKFPIEVELLEVSKFKKDKYDVIKISLKSKVLHELNKLISDKFENEDEFADDYKPHITIAYVKKDTCESLVGDKSFEDKKYKFSEIVFSSKENKKTAFDLSKTIASLSKREASPTNVKFWLSPEGQLYSFSGNAEHQDALENIFDTSKCDENVILCALKNGWSRGGLSNGQLYLQIGDWVEVEWVLNQLPPSYLNVKFFCIEGLNEDIKVNGGEDALSTWNKRNKLSVNIASLSIRESDSKLDLYKMDFSDLVDLAQDENTDSETLSELVILAHKKFKIKFPYEYVRLITSILENKNTSRDILLKFSKSNHRDILSAIVKNPNTPSEILINLSKHKGQNEFNFIRNFCQNPNTPIDVFKSFAKYGDIYDRKYICESKFTPPEILEYLYYKDEHDPSILESLAININTPVKILTKISKKAYRGYTHTLLSLLFNKSYPMDLKLILLENEDLIYYIFDQQYRLQEVIEILPQSAGRNLLKMYLNYIDQKTENNEKDIDMKSNSVDTGEQLYSMLLKRQELQYKYDSLNYHYNGRNIPNDSKFPIIKHNLSKINKEIMIYMHKIIYEWRQTRLYSRNDRLVEMEKNEKILEELQNAINSNDIESQRMIIEKALNTIHSSGQMIEHYDLSKLQLDYLSNLDTSKWDRDLQHLSNLKINKLSLRDKNSGYTLNEPYFDFVKYKEKIKNMTDEQLLYAIKDSKESAEAMKNFDPKAENWYWDEYFTCSDELNKRRKL